MIKKVFFVLSIFSLFLITSCANLNGGGYGKNHLNFEIGSRVADSITRTLTQNNAITDTPELTIECELLRGETPIKKDSLTVSLEKLYEARFNLNNIPNGNNYFISLSVYYKNHLIYTALSDLIVLNEENEEVNINLSLKQNNSKINYELNGGKFVPDQKVDEYFINSKVILPEPVKEMAMFEGWYTNSSFTGEPVTELGKAKFIGDVTLYAKWREFGVKFEPNIDKVDYQDVIKLLCNVPDSKIYYTTDGSKPTESSKLYVDGIVVDEKVVSELDDSIKINAIAVNNGAVSNVFSNTYTMKRYTVTYNKNGFGIEECSTVSNYKMNDTVQLPSLSQDMMVFNGWKLGDKLYKPRDKFKVTGDLVFDASWQGVVEPVQFSKQGEVDYEDKIKLTCATAGAVIHYSVGGGAYQTLSSPYEITITEPTTIEAYATKVDMKDGAKTSANYTIKKYTVRFNETIYGTIPAEITNLKKSDTITAAQLEITPTLNSGFEFKNWTDADGHVISANHSITKDLVLTANWNDIAPGPVTNVTSSIVNGKVRLTWTNPVDADFDKVIITCTDTTINETVEKTETNTATSVDIVIPDVDCNKGSYEFVITAYDKADPTAMSSTPEKITPMTLPVITSISSIPNWDKNSNKTGYEITATGTNMNVANITYACEISPEPVGFNFNLSVGSKTATTVPITFNIPNAVGEYTVTVRCLGVMKTQTFKVGAYAVGDTVMADGMIIPSTDISGYMKANPDRIAVAVIFRGADNTSDTPVLPALGVGLKQNESGIMWAKSGTTEFTNIICTPSQKEVGADTATFEGDVDGRNNWSVICGVDSTGTQNAATNYPAFDWVNKYGTNDGGLSGTGYTGGWYMPSIAELCELYREHKKIGSVVTAALTAVGGTQFRTDSYYWSSSQDGSDSNSAWELRFSDGLLNSTNKSFSNYVCCIRAF